MQNLRNSSYFVLLNLTLITTFFMACSPDDDMINTRNETNDLGDWYIDVCSAESQDLLLGNELAKNLVPEKYLQENSISILFKDSIGNELIFERIAVIDNSYSLGNEFQCGDSIELITMQIVQNGIYFAPTGKNFRFEITYSGAENFEENYYAKREWMQYNPNYNNTSSLNLPYGHTDIIYFENGEIIGSTATKVSSIELNGKTYKDVLVRDGKINGIQHYQYYNQEFGVLVFEEPSGKLWYFEEFID